MSLTRIIRRALIWLGVFVLIYGFGAVAGAIIAKPGEGTQGSEVEVLLVSGPIHYDFLLPLSDATRKEFSYLADAGLDLGHPAAKWLVIGWGAREFYTATGTYRDLKAKTVLKGLFGDQSVMRVDLAGRLSNQVKTRRLSLTNTQYRALLGSISASFRRDNAGRVSALDHSGFSQTDIFFEANGRFDLFRTCNVWIGQKLRTAGLRFGIWTPTPYAITLSHWMYQPPAKGQATQEIGTVTPPHTSLPSTAPLSLSMKR